LRKASSGPCSCTTNKFDSHDDTYEESNKKNATKGIYNHLKENKKHLVEWKKEISLDTEAQWTKRKIKGVIVY
jgi:hypothetical protein